MFMTESPVWSHRGLDATDHFSLGGVHRFQDYYNWTMTYRLDSTFPIPYGQFTQVNTKLLFISSYQFHLQYRNKTFHNLQIWTLTS